MTALEIRDRLHDALFREVNAIRQEVPGLSLQIHSPPDDLTDSDSLSLHNFMVTAKQEF